MVHGLFWERLVPRGLTLVEMEITPKRHLWPGKALTGA